MYISLRMEIREALAFKVYAQIEASDVEWPEIGWKARSE